MKFIEPESAFRDLGNELRDLGLNDQQLQSIRFNKNHRECPLDEWVMTWDQDITIEAMPTHLSKMRRYANLKFALIDGPAENSPYVSSALAQISNEPIYVMAADRLAYLGRQKAASEAPRGFIPEIGMTMREFVIKYATLGDNRFLRARGLWNGFGSHFSYASGLDMELVGKAYEYYDGRTLSYSTFRNYVAERNVA
jgi:hypothetical protein